VSRHDPKRGVLDLPHRSTVGRSSLFIDFDRVFLRSVAAARVAERHSATRRRIPNDRRSQSI
jgi:hypothetical protein